MEHFEISVTSRESQGTRQARNLRKTGEIPAVVYSRGEKALPISISSREFVHVAQKALPSQVFKLKSDDSQLANLDALVKDIQIDGQSGKVLHVDFQRLHPGQAVSVKIPLLVEGEAPGVKNEGGVLTKFTRDILVSCLPDSIPSTITINVSNLGLGQRIQACDIELPKGATLLGNPSETVVNVIAGREARLAESGDGAGAEAAPADAAAAKEGAAGAKS